VILLQRYVDHTHAVWLVVNIWLGSRGKLRNVHSDWSGEDWLEYVMNLLTIHHIQFVTQIQNENCKENHSDTMHRICVNISDRSRNRVIEVLKFQMVDNVGSVDNVEAIIIEWLHCLWKLLRFQIWKDLSGIPSPWKWVVSMTSSSKVAAVKICDCNRILHPGSRVIVVPGPTVTGFMFLPQFWWVVNCFWVVIAHLLCANLKICFLAAVISNLQFFWIPYLAVSTETPDMCQ